MTKQEFIESIRLEGEEWAEVPGWGNFYMVSSEGRIASVRTEVHYKGKKNPKKVEPFLLKGVFNKTSNGGYQVLRAYLHKKFRLFYVHRLVAEAFVPNPNPATFIEVDHIDGNPRNNKASNLRWTTRSGNMLNHITRERQSKSHLGQINLSQIKAVVRISPNGDVKTYPKMSDVILDGFWKSSVSECCSGKQKQHKGYVWMFLSDYDSMPHEKHQHP